MWKWFAFASPVDDKCDSGRAHIHAMAIKRNRKNERKKQRIRIQKLNNKINWTQPNSRTKHWIFLIFFTLVLANTLFHLLVLNRILINECSNLNRTNAKEMREKLHIHIEIFRRLITNYEPTLEYYHFMERNEMKWNRKTAIESSTIYD